MLLIIQTELFHIVNVHNYDAFSLSIYLLDLQCNNLSIFYQVLYSKRLEMYCEQSVIVMWIDPIIIGRFMLEFFSS